VNAYPVNPIIQSKLLTMAEIHVQAKKNTGVPSWVWIVLVLVIAAAVIYFLTMRNSKPVNNNNTNNTTGQLAAPAPAVSGAYLLGA
jgi:hypothetical protein